MKHQCLSGQSFKGQTDGEIQFARTSLADRFQIPKICGEIFFALAQTLVRDNSEVCDLVDLLSAYYRFSVYGLVVQL